MLKCCVHVASKSEGADERYDTGVTSATHEVDTTGGSSSESKQTESRGEEGVLGVWSTSLTGSSGSLSESEGRPKPEVRRR